MKHASKQDEIISSSQNFLKGKNVNKAGKIPTLPKRRDCQQSVSRLICGLVHISDLKSPTGRGKNVIYGLISKKRKQSDNFIIDISNCPLSDEEVERQIENLYYSPRIGFLEKIVLIKGEEVIKVYERK